MSPRPSGVGRVSKRIVWSSFAARGLTSIPPKKTETPGVNGSPSQPRAKLAGVGGPGTFRFFGGPSQVRGGVVRRARVFCFCFGGACCVCFVCCLVCLLPRSSVVVRLGSCLWLCPFVLACCFGFGLLFSCCCVSWWRVLGRLLAVCFRAWLVLVLALGLPSGCPLRLLFCCRSGVSARRRKKKVEIV